MPYGKPILHKYKILLKCIFLNHLREQKYVCYLFILILTSQGHTVQTIFKNICKLRKKYLYIK